MITACQGQEHLRPCLPSRLVIDALVLPPLFRSDGTNRVLFHLGRWGPNRARYQTDYRWRLSYRRGSGIYVFLPYLSSLSFLSSPSATALTVFIAAPADPA